MIQGRVSMPPAIGGACGHKPITANVHMPIVEAQFVPEVLPGKRSTTYAAG